MRYAIATVHLLIEVPEDAGSNDSAQAYAMDYISETFRGLDGLHDWGYIEAEDGRCPEPEVIAFRRPPAESAFLSRVPANQRIRAALAEGGAK